MYVSTWEEWLAQGYSLAWLALELRQHGVYLCCQNTAGAGVWGDHEEGVLGMFQGGGVSGGWASAPIGTRIR